MLLEMGPTLEMKTQNQSLFLINTIDRSLYPKSKLLTKMSPLK
jgi:hypothetical protein